ncbi:hypothetical protein [Actinomadura formosensis]
MPGEIFVLAAEAGTGRPGGATVLAGFSSMVVAATATQPEAAG